MDISKAFSKYVELLAPVLAHADRASPSRITATGLLLEGKRKSVEPMAARLEAACGFRQAPVACITLSVGRTGATKPC